jgi:nitrite reductase/ring-hydroxylating ferredoxin subunit
LNQEVGAGVRLCRLEEIADPGSKGFTVEERELFVVRAGETVVAYRNSCPHTGGPLDWIEGRFLDLPQLHILCATHGALFRVADGHCFAGPCQGQALTPVRIAVVGGEVRLMGQGATEKAEEEV